MTKRRFWGTSVVLTAFAMAALVFAGCDSPTGNDNQPGNGGGQGGGGATPATFTVTFNSHGGSAVADQRVTQGGTATRPQDPTRGGHTFTNWFGAQTGGAAFDFATAITRDTTIHARWQAVAVNGGNGTGTGNDGTGTGNDGTGTGDNGTGENGGGENGTGSNGTDENGDGDTTPVWEPTEAGLWNVTDPNNRFLVSGVGATNDAQVEAHLLTNQGTFVWAVGGNISTTAGIWLTGNNRNLTIVGFGEMRTITLNSTTAGTRLIFVGAETGTGSNIRLTIGDNITLTATTANRPNDLVKVVNGGRLYMEGNSVISGHTSNAPFALGAEDRGMGAAVNVSARGTFTMRDGTITGNRASNTGTSSPGGVFVHAQATRFYMSGGSITGNFRGATGSTQSDLSVPANLITHTGGNFGVRHGVGTIPPLP
jgi:hypothetical protein